MRMYMLAAATALVISGCQSGGSANVSLDTADERASYAIGMDIANSLEVVQDHILLDQLIAGLTDVRAGGETRLSPEEIQTVMTEFNQTVQAEQQAKRAEDMEENRAEGAAFLAENGAKEGVVTTESGLQYEILEEGNGAKPAADDRVVVHYKGTLTDGTEFDSSYGGTPATFAVGGVIPGFTEALMLMNVGSKYRVFIPGDLAYGEAGSPPVIGPNSTLVFELELLEIAD